MCVYVCLTVVITARAPVSGRFGTWANAENACKRFRAGERESGFEGGWLSRGLEEGLSTGVMSSPSLGCDSLMDDDRGQSRGTEGKQRWQETLQWLSVLESERPTVAFYILGQLGCGLFLIWHLLINFRYSIHKREDKLLQHMYFSESNESN